MSTVRISLKNQLVAYACLLVAIPWPLIIVYLFYLGISTGDWTSDQFFKWEGISAIFVIPFIFGGAWATVYFAEKHERRTGRSL